MKTTWWECAGEGKYLEKQTHNGGVGEKMRKGNRSNSNQVGDNPKEMATQGRTSAFQAG